LGTGVQLRQTPTDFDVQVWLRARGFSEAQVERACDELRTIRVEYSGWQRQPRHGLSARQRHSIDIERDAHRVRMVEIAVVPGLVRTQRTELMTEMPYSNQAVRDRRARRFGDRGDTTPPDQ
jgi:hypothetical protein